VIKRVIVVIEAEDRDLSSESLEILQSGQDLATQSGGEFIVVLPGWRTTTAALHLGNYGVKNVVCIEHEKLQFFSSDAWCRVLDTYLNSFGSGIILMSDTSHARSLIPRLALQLKSSIVTGCLHVFASDGVVYLVRTLYGGSLHEHFAYSNGGFLLVSLTPGARGLNPTSHKSKVEITVIAPDLSETTIRDRVTQIQQMDHRTIDVSESEKIVSVGLGMGNAETLKMVQQLAGRLKAALGATRPVIDRGWLPVEREIGVSGKSVSPGLYLALGISGAPQHTMGMARSKNIIAVNTDPAAPIFNLADLGIIGDINEIIPELLEQIKNTDHNSTEKKV